MKSFEGYCTDVFFDEAMSFIEKNRERPFFCYLAPNAPHYLYNVPEKYCSSYRGKMSDDRAQFFGMISNLDENFGRLRRHLEKLGIAEDTILVYETDNGTTCGCSLDSEQQVNEGFNAGMRGIKCSPYEGGHRVPFFIKWNEGNIKGGREISQLTANVDFMPTILDLCGIDVPDGRTFDGVSLAPLLLDEKAEWVERTVVTDSQRLVRPKK